MNKLIFWEMNEINFKFLKFYINQGKLPRWKKFIEEHGVFTTVSEKKYEELEPWIQWPTVRTGLEYAEHKVFRLGDIENSNIKQHWEILEEHGFSVAAVSPINGSNKTQKSPFWIPDPWVTTKISGNRFIHRITAAVKQSVNDNAQEKLSYKTILALIEGLLTKTQLSSWSLYFKGTIGALKKQHWSKALVLDRLLADIYIYLFKKYQPDFSTLFLNSGAHIQHHYMCGSPAYKGSAKNPDWYLKKNKDPLLDILELYDDILGELTSLKDTRLMISVGLQQVPYEQPTFYWRLKNHNEFLSKIGIKYTKVLPRMTRDFLIEFDDNEQLKNAEKILSGAISSEEIRIFNEVDNRGSSLYVTLTYPNDIDDDFSFFWNNQEYKNFKEDIVFVAIKNGHHDTLGYYLDTNRKPGELEENIPLKNLFGYVMEHFNIRGLK